MSFFHLSHLKITWLFERAELRRVACLEALKTVKRHARVAL